MNGEDRDARTGQVLDFPRTYAAYCPRCGRVVTVTVDCWRSRTSTGAVRSWRDVHRCPVGHVLYSLSGAGLAAMLRGRPNVP